MGRMDVESAVDLVDAGLEDFVHPGVQGELRHGPLHLPDTLDPITLRCSFDPLALGENPEPGRD